MIDISTEELIPLREAPARLPGRRVHLSALYRWVQRKPCGLEIIRIGGRTYTSVQALERFIRRCTFGEDAAPPAPSARRQREIRKAEAECESLGV